MQSRVLAICLIAWATCASIDDRARLFAQSDPRVGNPAASGAGTAANRLYVADLFLMDTIHNAVGQLDARAQRKCAHAADLAGCKDRESRGFSVQFVRVRRGPSPTATIAGDLFAIGRRTGDAWQFDLVYRAAGDTRPRSWLRDVDPFYGPTLSGVRSRGDWIGFFGGPFDGDAWIYAGVNHKNLRGEASSIAGHILELHDVRVRTATGDSRPLSGSYFITRVDRAGVVTFREELDIDMPCGEDVSRPAVMPPTFRAPASAFFDTDGRPRFEVKYTKGC